MRKDLREEFSVSDSQLHLTHEKPAPEPPLPPPPSPPSPPPLPVPPPPLLPQLCEI